MNKEKERKNDSMSRENKPYIRRNSNIIIEDKSE